MKYIILCVAVTLFIDCTSKHELKISSKQEKFALFIKQYQDSISAAPDSVGKTKLFNRMWAKRIKYIQDPFQIPTIPTDTFIFNNAVVRDSINPKDDQEYLEIALDNGNYAAEIIYTGVKNGYVQQSAIYRMAKNLKQDVPVKVIGNLINLSLSYPNIEIGTKKIMLDMRVDSIVNAY